MEWETVIGLEVHVQLQTQSKIFSNAPIAYGAEANTQANIIDLAMPGVLPVLNAKVIDMAIMLALATNSQIDQQSIFARKNYFYPDLPKGYQISQYENPIVHNGYLDITLDDGQQKRINITRAHLEEDAGKSLHGNFQGKTGIDLNRAGTPLLEVVSEPELRSAAEAVAYLKTLHELVCYLDICDGNMQEGSFRCDANVSIRPRGQEALGTRTETKNVNSFRFVEKAINYEVARQISLLENGEQIIQETRLYDPDNNQTRSMRSKEEANDYRYFPDPDLLPVSISDEQIAEIQKQMPELPAARRQRLQSELGLSDYDANVITASRKLADYFEKVVELSHAETKLVANWVMGDFSAALNKENFNITQCPVSAELFAGLLRRIHDNTISNSIGKKVFSAMWQTHKSADMIIEEQGLKQVTDSAAIEKIIDEILEDNPEQLAQFRAGKDKLFGFFVGKVMQASKGKANPQQVNNLLKQKLFTDSH